MDKLQLEATKSTPEVQFDSGTGILTITGQSYPENAFKFYEPLFEWMDNYLARVQTSTVVTFKLQMPYINTSSMKCLMMLLEKLDDAFENGKHIQVVWQCAKDNESEIECAEEFMEDLRLPFNILLVDEAL
ncbi:hypothetical protein D3C85_739050 [compost metagenome]